MSETDEVEPRCGLCAELVIDAVDRSGRPWGHCLVRPRSGTVGEHDDVCHQYRFEPRRLAPVPPAAPRPPPARAPRARPAEPARIRLTEIPLEDEGEPMDREELKSILAEVLDETLGLSDTPIHPRFRGGKVIIQPANTELQSKELPIDVLFRKIVAIRDKLRVLEQKVNASEGMDHQDKVQLQSYISACYGSLTSFNFLFKEKEDGFSS